MKNSPFDLLFLVNLVFSLRIFSVLEIYHVRLYIVEKWGFGMAFKQCGIHYRPSVYLAFIFQNRYTCS